MESRRKIESPSILDVHEEKGNVLKDVDDPETLIEFDAVKYDWGMFETDVLAVEITVTIPYVSVPPSFGEFIFVISYKCPRVRHEQPEYLLINGQCSERLDLFEILFRGSAYGFDAPEFPASVRCGILMKQGQCSAHVVQRAIEGPSFTDQLEEETVERNALHSYSVLRRQTTLLESKAKSGSLLYMG